MDDYLEDRDLRAALCNSGPLGGNSLDEFDCLELSDMLDDVLAGYSIGTITAAISHRLVTDASEDPDAIVALIALLIRALYDKPNN